MIKKPSNLIYGVDDKPPFFITVILGLQHVSIFFISIVMPVVIITQMGNTISPEVAQSFISMSMLAGGLTTILQVLHKGPIGSGYLCPAVCGPSYLSASVSAAAVGGLPLLYGMTLIAGLIEVIFSRFIQKLRILFPPEVIGLVVAMVGIVVIPLSIKCFFGLGPDDTQISMIEVSVGVITLVSMIGFNIFGKGQFKLFCTLIGIFIGYIVSLLLGLISTKEIHEVLNASFFSIPHLSHIRWAFDFSLLVPFTVATICSTFKTVGDLACAQKVNDTNWRRADMKSVSKGIFADGLGGVIPGILGGFGQSTSSSNVGLSVATAATSRVIGYAAGVILIFLAFFPKLAEFFLIMPKPVMGAALIFSVSFMIIAGFQIMMSRMLDIRKTFVIGISLIFGLSVDIMPHLYQNIHPWIKPIFSSSLSLATVLAIGLNLLFRIGIAKKVRLELQISEPLHDKTVDFFENQGRTWGVRPEIIHKTIVAIDEFFECIPFLDLNDEKIFIDVKFDEFNLDIWITYEGILLDLNAKKPTIEELNEAEIDVSRLAKFMLKQFADKVEVSQNENRNIVFIHFEH